MRYRVEVSSQDGDSGGWSRVEAEDPAVAVGIARVEWGERFPVVDRIEEDTHEPRTAYRVEVVSADGAHGDRVYQEATSREAATALVLARYPGYEHRGTYPDDPA